MTLLDSPTTTATATTTSYSSTQRDEEQPRTTGATIVLPAPTTSPLLTIDRGEIASHATIAMPSSPLATPTSPHRRGIDEEIGISPLPPIYTRDVPPRHSVVAISPQSTQNLLSSPTEEPPPPPEDEPLPEYSRYPKSEAEAITAAYRGNEDGDDSRRAGKKKIFGVYARSLVTGVIILIIACVIVGGVVGYQMKNGWANLQKDDTSNNILQPNMTWYSDEHGQPKVFGDGSVYSNGLPSVTSYQKPIPTVTVTLTNLKTPSPTPPSSSKMTMPPKRRRRRGRMES